MLSDGHYYFTDAFIALLTFQIEEQRLCTQVCCIPRLKFLPIMTMMYEELLLGISILLDTLPISKIHNSFFPQATSSPWTITIINNSQNKNFQPRSPFQVLSKLLFPMAHSKFPLGYLAGFSHLTYLKHNIPLHTFLCQLLPWLSNFVNSHQVIPARNPRTSWILSFSFNPISNLPSSSTPKI